MKEPLYPDSGLEIGPLPTDSTLVDPARAPYQNLYTPALDPFRPPYRRVDRSDPRYPLAIPSDHSSIQDRRETHTVPVFNPTATATTHHLKGYSSHFVNPCSSPTHEDYLGGERSTSHRRDKPLNRFFVDGQGLEDEVIQQEVKKFLGPEATVESVVHRVCLQASGIPLQ